jgi:hypothetical protein
MEKPETQETNQIAPMEMDQDTLQEAFEVGLKVLLSTWPTLIMASENGFGGGHRRTLEKIWDLYETIIDMFNGTKKANQFDIEDLLDDFLQTQIHTIVQDGSSNKIASLTVRIYDKSMEGDMKEINDFLKKCFTMSPVDKVFGGKKPSQFPIPDEERPSVYLYRSEDVSLLAQRTKKMDIGGDNNNDGSESGSDEESGEDDENNNESNDSTNNNNNPPAPAPVKKPAKNEPDDDGWFTASGPSAAKKKK